MSESKTSPLIPDRLATACAGIMAALRRVLGRPPQPTTAQRQAEAAHGVEVAARREAADEVIRATSRRVMNEMWPSKATTSPPPPAVSPPAPAAPPAS